MANLRNIEEEIENKIIDQIALDASGRLVIFKPENDILGADLVVEKRGKYKENKLYFKINSFSGATENKKIIRDFLKDNFIADKNLYLLFVYFDEIKQRINDYIWLVPSLQFKDIAESVQSPEGQKMLRFESSLEINNKNKYSKYLIKTKELGDLIIGAFESGGKFSFKDSGFEDGKIINLEGLKDLISEARANTYASDATFDDSPRLLGSKQLEFQKAEYFYRDIYFSGNAKIFGQEVVYKDSNPVWIMNYIGTAIDKNTEKFLKDSLLRLSRKCRFNESCEFEKREYKYQNIGQGSLEDFSGQEYIFLNGKKIYTLTYQGGLL